MITPKLEQVVTELKEHTLSGRMSWEHTTAGTNRHRFHSVFPNQSVIIEEAEPKGMIDGVRDLIDERRPYRFIILDTAGNEAATAYVRPGIEGYQLLASLFDAIRATTLELPDAPLDDLLENLSTLAS